MATTPRLPAAEEQAPPAPGVTGIDAAERVAVRGSPAPRPEPRSRPAVAPAAPAPDTTAELNELRDDYDTLSVRGEAVDDSLNRLWEEMRPLSPRLDMATRQRSLKTYLARSRDALTEKNAAQAKRYLDMARADLAALEQFLGR